MPYAPGTKFGHLTVIERLPDYITPSGAHKLKYLCECDCPDRNRVEVTATHLASGHTTSCGCVSRQLASERMTEMNTIHGKADTGIYKSYTHMIDRCYNPFNKDYCNYGARGITICDEWYNPNFHGDVERFKNFYNWAFMNGFRDEFTLDRIKVDGNYEPGNCRWVDAYVQANNKRNSHYVNFNGNKITVAQLANILGVDSSWFYNYLYNRNFNLSSIFATFQTPYGPVTHLVDPYGNIIPTHCLYFVDQYGYPISEVNYRDPEPVPALYQLDANGFIDHAII